VNQEGIVMKRLRPLLLALAIVASPFEARASTEPFIGELMLTGYNFCPQGWAMASGQLLAIQQNTALFSLLGTQFGGNGQTTFALPDLRGRAPIGAGQGPGLSERVIGEQGGEEAITLLQSQLPIHNHAAGASTLAGNSVTPANALPAKKFRTQLYRTGSSADSTLAPDAIGVAGGSQPHSNVPPFTAMTWCIAVQGIFPQRP
jgi:microcystin-dependent protein